MSYRFKVSLFVLGLFSALYAMPTMFQSVESEQATLLQKGDEKPYCPNCGMNLVKFFKTSHAARLKNGEVRQYCSLHCLVDERMEGYLKDKENLIDQILVVDTKSLELINAKEAIYVIGSDRPATMSRQSEYAFKNRADAQEFVKAYGGEMMDFAKAYALKKAEHEADKEMIRKKREVKLYPKAEKVYEESCDKQALSNLHVHTIAELKAHLIQSDVCKKVDEGLAQALAIYIWDKRYTAR